jgi:hypothetical protein
MINYRPTALLQTFTKSSQDSKKTPYRNKILGFKISIWFPTKEIHISTNLYRPATRRLMDISGRTGSHWDCLPSAESATWWTWARDVQLQKNPLPHQPEPCLGNSGFAEVSDPPGGKLQGWFYRPKTLDYSGHWWKLFTPKWSFKMETMNGI